jgi:hypothetical protein
VGGCEGIFNIGSWVRKEYTIFLHTTPYYSNTFTIQYRYRFKRDFIVQVGGKYIKSTTYSAIKESKRGIHIIQNERNVDKDKDTRRHTKAECARCSSEGKEKTKGKSERVTILAESSWTYLASVRGYWHMCVSTEQLFSKAGIWKMEKGNKSHMM